MRLAGFTGVEFSCRKKPHVRPLLAFSRLLGAGVGREDGPSARHGRSSAEVSHKCKRCARAPDMMPRSPGALPGTCMLLGAFRREEVRQFAL